MYLILKQKLVSAEDLRNDPARNRICDVLYSFIKAVHHLHILTQSLFILNLQITNAGPVGQDRTPRPAIMGPL